MTKAENQESTYQWGCFIWKTDNDDKIEIDPFHIKAWGIQSAKDQENKPAWVVWLDVGSPRIFTHQFDKPGPASLELDRIRNAKMRN